MKDRYSRLSASNLLTALFAAALLAGCGAKTAPVQALEISQKTVCALDDMVLQDFPGPKAQIHYEQSAPEFYCDTREMFSIVLRPEQKRRIVAVYTQDMGQTDWTHPQGHWIDARGAFYVVGSSRKGSMGPTVASFGAEADAKTFSAQYGGKVLRFDQVTVDMVDLTGGIVHDEKM